MFSVSYSKQARKFLLESEKTLAKRLVKKIEQLTGKPFMHDTKIVEGYTEKLFRVRVGDYRILYEIDYSNKLIGIVKIEHRSKAY